MALETLKEVKELDGEKVIVMDDLREQYPEKFNESGSMDYEWFEKEIRPNHFIYVRHDKNSISFTIQNGPIKENGKNGCQVTALVAAAEAILNGLNKNFPCGENVQSILCLRKVLELQEKRTMNRKKRGVEGTNQA